jgi:hypothetical protein
MSEQTEGASAPDANAILNAPQAEATTEQTGSEAAPSPAATNPGEQQAEPEKKGYGKRIDELTRLRRDAERDRDYWRDLAMRTAIPQPTRQEEPPKLPTLAEFGYDEKKYADAVKADVLKEAKAAFKAEAEQWAQKQTTESRKVQFDERAAAFAKANSDFYEVFNESLPVSQAMAESIIDSDDGPAVAYYLGNNPDVAARIARLSPVQAGREIAKIEVRLAAEREKASQKPVSKAPAPPPHVTGSDPGTTVKSASDPESDRLSAAEWARLREKELRRRK